MPSAAAPSTPLRDRLARLLAAATVAYAVVLVLATHYPRPQDFLGPNPPSDKTLHFLAYATLASLAGGTLVVARRWSGRWMARLAAWCAAFAVVDEATQPFFSRAADPLDWVYDCLGIAMGLATIAVATAIVRRARDRHDQLGVGGR